MSNESFFFCFNVVQNITVFVSRLKVGVALTVFVQIIDNNVRLFQDFSWSFDLFYGR